MYKYIVTVFFLIAAVSLNFVFAQTANFPARPIKIIVSTPPGSGGDIIGRAIAQGLSELTKQQVFVENRIGAGGIIGALAIANSAPDGYTLGIAVTSHVVAPLMQKKPAYDPIKDFTAISQITTIPNLVIASGKSNIKTLPELIAQAKMKSEELNFGSLGDGTAAHLAAEILNRATGIKATHIPYRTIADSYTGLWAGDVLYLVYLVPSGLPAAQDGKAKILATTGKTRSAVLPDTPTVRELGFPTAESEMTIGLIGPAKIPLPIVQKIHNDITEVLKMPDVRERLLKQGGLPSPDISSKQYAERLAQEYEDYKRLISTIGLVQQ